MRPDAQLEIGELHDRSLEEVRRRWRERFKTPAPAHRSKDLLIRAYAFELQARGSGGLKRELKRKLEELAARFSADASYAPSATSALKPGSVYVRYWGGQRYAVTATEDGYLFDGKTRPSLSAVAFAITGVKWSGPRFFRETPTAQAQQP